MQNTSHAVMAQRIEPKDSADDFPTPPRATRALVEHVFDDKNALRSMSPACGAGHMARCSRSISVRSMPSTPIIMAMAPFELRLVLCGRIRRLAYARGVGAAVSKSARSSDDY